VSSVAWDPVTGGPVLLAPGRAARPHDTRAARNPSRRPCPFCEGAEQDTPLETYAERPEGGEPNTPGWSVRVVPNKFPVIAEDEGIHEVVIPTSRHVVELTELTEQEAARALRVWAIRLEAIGTDPRGLWPFCFVNQGAAAGASLQHTHAQIVGLPVEPPRLLAIERTFARANPVAEDLAAADTRLVAEADGMAAWCPAVPPYTGTVRIAPREPTAALGEHTDFGELGRLLLDVATRIDSALGAPSLNLLVHQRRPVGPDAYHWHIDVVPRVGTLAGLELGSGVIAIAGAPEATAARLRQA